MLLREAKHILAPPSSKRSSGEGVRLHREHRRARPRPKPLPQGHFQSHGHWPAPSVAGSVFFAERGFVLRPTEGRVSFLVFASGKHRYTLLRHPKNQAILYCRDTVGSVTRISGAGFWFDNGDRVEALCTEDEACSRQITPTEDLLAYLEMIDPADIDRHRRELLPTIEKERREGEFILLTRRIEKDL